MKPVTVLAVACLAAATSSRAADAPAPSPAATPTYVEFNVRDEARAKRFYGAVFGWTFVDYGPDYASFAAGGIAGGFAKGAPSGGGPLVVFPVSDLEGTLSRVTAAGGRVTKPIFAYPGGRRFHFRDPDGYEIAVWSEH